jgi:hypothetical protein
MVLAKGCERRRRKKWRARILMQKHFGVGTDRRLGAQEDAPMAMAAVGDIIAAGRVVSTFGTP